MKDIKSLELNYVNKFTKRKEDHKTNTCSSLTTHSLKGPRKSREPNIIKTSWGNNQGIHGKPVEKIVNINHKYTTCAHIQNNQLIQAILVQIDT